MNSQYQEFISNTMITHLGIEFIETGDKMVATMPVDHRTHQPAGLLHGGASVTLIESLGSFGSALRVNLSQYNVVGIEVNANHIKSISKGYVRGEAQLVHEGSQTHLWEAKIYSPEHELICSGRLTVMIIAKNNR